MRSDLAELPVRTSTGQPPSFFSDESSQVEPRLSFRKRLSQFRPRLPPARARKSWIPMEDIRPVREENVASLATRPTTSETEPKRLPRKERTEFQHPSTGFLAKLRRWLAKGKEKIRGWKANCGA
ncbi:MAG: hypothetical protein M1824_001463 [Vezdaea acicularis]|nr:MAG: hypothetical protein M1824_001463 [Vezdaea acicularis]